MQVTYLVRQSTLRCVVVLLLSVCRHTTHSAPTSTPASLSDPVANACSPLCKEENDVEIQCAKERGCYDPAIKDNPDLFENCWKDCWYLAGRCFSLCAENFDVILGKCYGDCKPDVEVDCIAGCFDLTFMALKHETFNNTENFTESIGNFNFTGKTTPLSGGSPSQDLLGASVNSTPKAVVTSKLLGTLGSWSVFEEVTYQEDNEPYVNLENTVELKPEDGSKRRTNILSEEVRLVEFNELESFYQAPDGTFHKVLEHYYDKSMWDQIVANYENSLGNPVQILDDALLTEKTQKVAEARGMSTYSMPLPFSGSKVGFVGPTEEEN